MFNFILVPLKWIIDSFYGFTGSYALSIVLFTLVIKLILTPLDIKQRNNMRKLTKLNPKLNVINERYANDPDKKAQKTMELYKKEKVSPFSSCLPMLIQLPILFAMISVMNSISYDAMMNMFLEAHAGNPMPIESFLWVRNIFQPDTITAPVFPELENLLVQLERAKNTNLVTPENLALLEAHYTTVMAPYVEQFAGYANGWSILPILAGGLQFLQTKLMPSNASADANQNKNQKMMNYLFPLMSVFFCWSFSSAFALYWVASSVFGILSQLLITLYYKQLDKKEEQQPQIS